MLKKIGPYKILNKCGANAYHVDLPPHIQLPSILKVVHLYAYKGIVGDHFVKDEPSSPQEELLNDLLKPPTLVIEFILGKRVVKETRRSYYE